jgi:GntR family transcriptional regulator
MEFKDKQSIYIQIGDYICENILLGVWQIGERIPSTREFAAEIEVNPNTVVRTYNHLEDLEIIKKKRGIGYFVNEGAINVISDMKKKDFVKEQLPEIFKQMELLNISWDEMNSYYNEYKEGNNK